MSGISRYMLMLLDGLFKLDTENRYTVLVNPTLHSDDPLLHLVGHTANAEIRVINLPHIGPSNYTKMPSIVKSLKPDLYHFPNLDAPISGFPTVATIHDAGMGRGVKRFDDKFGLKALYFKYSLRNTLKKADRLMFISNAIKGEILESHKMKDDATRFKVVYNGFDHQFGKVDPTTLEVVKHKHHLPEKYFLYVGALREHKNIHRVLEAYTQLNLPGWELVLVGSQYEKFPLDLARPGVRYLGMLSEEELKAVYKLSKGLVFASLFEGFGFPILEAMSLGVPVITTHYGATSEVGGDAVCQVDPFKVADIASGMRRVANDPQYAASLVEKGNKRVLDFSWGKTARETMDVYLEIMQ